MSDLSKLKSGVDYLSSRDASRAFKVTNDYIARLCRQGKLRGVLEGRTWYVETGSMKEFFGEPSSIFDNSGVRIFYKAPEPLTEAAQPVSVATHPAITTVCPPEARAHMRGRTPKRRDLTAATAFVRSTVLGLLLISVFGLASGMVLNNRPLLATQAQEQFAAAGALGDFLSGFANTARAVAYTVDSILYQIVAPRAPVLVQSTTATQPRTTAVATTTQTTTTPSSGVTVINQPVYTKSVQEVIERVIETQRVVVEGGVSEEYVNQRVDALENNLRSLVLASTASSVSSNAATYQVVAQTNRIDSLDGVDISDSSISGGSITNVTISGGTIAGASFSGTTTLSALELGSGTTTGSNGFNIANGCFSVNGTCITGGGAGSPGGADTQVQYNDGGSFNGVSSFTFNETTGVVSATGASTSRATSTDLITVNATSSVSFFSALGRFTNSVISTLNAAVASITDLTATTLVATNATTTTFYADTASTTRLFSNAGTFGSSTIGLLTTTGTSTGANGFNIAAGCFAVNGTCISSGSSASSTLLADVNTWSAHNIFSTGFLSLASTTIGGGTQATGLTISGGATTTGNLIVQGTGTSTFAGALQTTALNLTSTGATSTAANGFNIANGCYAINGTCLTSGSASLTGTTGQLAYFSGANTAVGTSSIFLATSGNVGIGTTTPAKLLELVKTGTGLQTALQLTNGNAAAADTGSFLSFSGIGDKGTGGIFSAWNGAATTDSYMSFYTRGSDSSTEKVRITSTGNFGIGTTTPSAKLTVFGDAFLNGTDRYLNYGTTTGSDGYGLRDNAGTLEFKNYGGTWQGVTTATSGPSFFVHKNGTAQTVTASTITVLTWNTETFDTNNNFDLSTERFTPTVPGKYIVTLEVYCNDSSNFCQNYIYKNDNVITTKFNYTDSTETSVTATAIVDMNGTTDYLEARALNSNGTSIHGGSNTTYFTGALIAPVSATAGGFTNDNTQSYLIDTTDKLGIGTTTPWGKLSVLADDNASTPQFVVASSSAVSLIVSATGNVGIGTTSPYAKLSVAGHVVGQYFTATSTSNASTFPYASSTALSISGTSYFAAGIWSASGLVGISTTTPNGALSIAGAANDFGTLSVYASSQTGTNRAFAVYGDPAQTVPRFMVRRDGNVGLGTTTPSGQLSIVGTVGSFAGQAGALVIHNTSNTLPIQIAQAADTHLYLGYNSASIGTFNSGTGAYTALSDARFKTNVADMQNGLETLTKLRPVSYQWDVAHGSSTDLGFIAQEVQVVIPDIVKENMEGYLTMDYTRIVPVITKAVQELNVKVDMRTGGLVALDATDIAPLSATTTALELVNATSSLATTTPWIAAFATSSPDLIQQISGLADTVIHVLGRAVYAVTGVFERIFAKEITTDSLNTKKLCIDDVCVTKEQLQALLSGASSQQAGAAATEVPPETSQPAPEAPSEENSENAETPAGEQTPADESADIPVETAAPEAPETSAPQEGI